MAKLTQQEEAIDKSRSEKADASAQDYICQTADNAETKKIFDAKSKSKSSLKSKTSKSPTKSSGRYGKGKKTNTSRLSQKS